MGADVAVGVETPRAVGVVWRLRAEPAELVRWLGVSATLEPSPDGRFRFELFPGQAGRRGRGPRAAGRPVPALPGPRRPAQPPGPRRRAVSIDVQETALIDRPRPDVAGYAMDPANDTRWIGGIREVAWVTEPPLRVGSRVRRLARFLGRPVDYVLEVADLDPQTRVVMRSVRAPFPMVVTYTFADDGGRTRAGVRSEEHTSELQSQSNLVCR